MKKLNLKTIGALGAAGMIALGVVGMQAATAFAQAPNPPVQSQSVVTGTDTIEAPAAGETVEAKGADLDTIQAGPGQQLEQQGGSNLDGNF